MNQQSSHIGHIAYIVLALLLGALVGYYVGNQYSQSATLENNTYIPIWHNQEDNNPTADTSKTTLSTVSSTTADETAGWKTYLSDKYGYSLKYPSNLYLNDWLYNMIDKKRVDEQKHVFISKKPMTEDEYLFGSDFPQPYLHIYIQDSEIKNVTAANPGEKVTSITFAGEQAGKHILTKPSDLAGDYYSQILLNHKSRGYYITWANSDGNDTHDKEIDQIISSFKFTN